MVTHKNEYFNTPLCGCSWRVIQGQVNISINKTTNKHYHQTNAFFYWSKKNPNASLKQTELEIRFAYQVKTTIGDWWLVNKT